MTEPISPPSLKSDELYEWVESLPPGTAVWGQDNEVYYKCDPYHNHESPTGFMVPHKGRIVHFAEIFKVKYGK